MQVRGTVDCQKCEALGPLEQTEEKAAKSWNSRRNPIVQHPYTLTRRKPDEGFRISWTVATLAGEFLGVVQLSATDLTGYWWVYVGQEGVPHEEQSAGGTFFSRRRDAIKHLLKEVQKAALRGQGLFAGHRKPHRGPTHGRRGNRVRLHAQPGRCASCSATAC